MKTLQPWTLPLLFIVLATACGSLAHQCPSLPLHERLRHNLDCFCRDQEALFVDMIPRLDSLKYLRIFTRPGGSQKTMDLLYTVLSCPNLVSLRWEFADCRDVSFTDNIFRE
jgi:hypothetical protein